MQDVAMQPISLSLNPSLRGKILLTHCLTPSLRLNNKQWSLPTVVVVDPKLEEATGVATIDSLHLLPINLLHRSPFRSLPQKRMMVQTRMMRTIPSGTRATQLHILVTSLQSKACSILSR